MDSSGTGSSFWHSCACCILSFAREKSRGVGLCQLHGGQSQLWPPASARVGNGSGGSSRGTGQGSSCTPECLQQPAGSLPAPTGAHCTPRQCLPSRGTGWVSCALGDGALRTATNTARMGAFAASGRLSTLWAQHGCSVHWRSAEQPRARLLAPDHGILKTQLANPRSNWRKTALPQESRVLQSNGSLLCSKSFAGAQTHSSTHVS